MNQNEKSLHDVHSSIDPLQKKGKWKKMFAFFGPAYLVSVGYMDPGNWATDIAGGSHFGYALLWVLLMSNFMALLLQSLSARLGIVQGRDLAQCSRDIYPPAVNIALYALAEIAIAACDLAEVLGMAIGLNLLFHIPLLWGVIITLADTLLLLYLQKMGMRKMEAFIVALVVIIGGCFLTEIFLAKPDFGDVAKGLVPSLPDSSALYIAIGIIGATVMPHNLYLHSALVQTRKIGISESAIRKAIKVNVLDSTIALNIAFFVNAAILIMAGTIFYNSGNQGIASIQDAHQLLQPLLGSHWAPILFAVALIAAGQSSTVTGTLAGQIIMEGYLHIRLNPVARRLLTRLLAIVPAVITILVAGERLIDDLLVFSQVLLSMQLAFAVIPLIHFVSDKERMGTFAIKLHTKIAAWVIASIILVLNIKLFAESAMGWLHQSPNIFVKGLVVLLMVGFALLLVITIIYPFIRKEVRAGGSIHPDITLDLLPASKDQVFHNIALALDFSEKDRSVLRYAMMLAKDQSRFVLIHIVESASALAIGSEADDFETVRDAENLEKYVVALKAKGYEAIGQLGFKSRVNEISRIVKEKNCDLLVVGSHGHKSLKDLLLGETINSVRHKVEVPVFIAR